MVARGGAGQRVGLVAVPGAPGAACSGHGGVPGGAGGRVERVEVPWWPVAALASESGWWPCLERPARPAQQEVNATVLIRVGQWFISGIHDSAILLHPFEEVIHDVICALRELKREDRLLRVAMVRSSRHDESVHLNPGVLRARRADTSGSRKDLSGDQKGHKRPEAAPRKWEAS